MKTKLFKKLVSFFLSLSLLANSVSAPLIVLAQSGDPEQTPTPTPEVTASPSAEPTLAPTDEPTSTPEVSPILDATIAPEETVTPTPVLEEVLPASTENTDNSSQPTNESAQSQAPPEESASPSSEATISPVQPTIEGDLSTTIVQEGDSYSIDVLSYDGYTVTTDKLDYAPTDTAIITGTNFTASETYSLTVSSTDEPATSTTVSVTADANGEFVYAYQLDGIYRLNYKVEVKSGEFVVAETSFTDSPVSGTLLDSDGPNDEPGQKDLNQLTFDYTNVLTGSIDVGWSWDDAGFPGANTGDACALFDSDNDGYANYALCVTVDDDPATYQATSLYSCGDNRSDRCTSESAILPFTSTCGASVQGTDPFPGPPAADEGDDYPDDTVASCTTQLSEVGGASSELLDVCSFPSSISHSDPSDCIVASTAGSTGLLEVKKSLSPTSDSGLFNLQIDGTTYAYDATHNGSTGEKVVDADDHTVGETAGTSTSLSNYTSTIQCLNAAGAPVSTTGGNPWTVAVGNGDDIVCTITNTLNQGTLIVVKNIVNDDGGLLEADDFSFQVDGGTATSFEADGQNDLTVNPGTYDVTEPAVTGYSTTYDNCTDVVVPSSGSATCTITNDDIAPLLTVTKIVAGGSALVSDFDLFVDATQVTSGVQNAFDVGSYVVSETPETGYTGVINGDCDLQGNVGLALGDVKSCTITNTRDTGFITVHKLLDSDGDGQYDDGGNTEANTLGFDWGLDAETPARDMGTTATGVLTGAHTVTEDSVTDYHFVGWFPGNPNSTQYSCTNLPAGEQTTTVDVNVTDDQTTEVTFCNARDTGTIVIIKDANPNSENDFTFDTDLPGVGGVFDLEDDGDDNNGGTEESITFNVPTGSYSVDEQDEPGWELTNLECSDENNSDTDPGGLAEITLDINETVTCTYTNTQLGSVSGSKFEDLDGILGGTQNPVSNWAIQLWKWIIDSWSFQDSTTTNGSGFYSFSNLLPGLYQIREGTEVGWTNMSPLVIQEDLSAGEVSTENDFVNTQYGSITVYKNVDFNGDGDLDDAEIDAIQAPGWTWDIDGAGNYSASFGENTVGDLLPGTYTISEDQQAGYHVIGLVCDGETNYGAVESQEISLSSNQDLVCTFTNSRDTGTIVILKDAINNSENNFTFDTDMPGVGGVFDLEDDGDDNNGGTDEQITFNIPIGTYWVDERDETGWELTNLECSDENNSDTDPDGRADITLDTNETVTCTYTNTELGNVTVVKYNDHNGNGIKDDGDETLDGWEIWLDEMAQWTGAQVAGQVTFSDLLPGSFTLSEQENEPDWVQTNIACGDEEGIDADNSHPVELAAGQDLTCYIGNQGRGSITVYKNVDFNGDGDLDDAEIDAIQAPGWTWDIDGAGNYSASFGENTVGVPAGSHTISEDQQTDYHVISLVCGETNYGAVESQEIALNPGDDLVCTFTNSRDTGDLEVTKYNDLDGNGQQDPGEGVLAGWEINVENQTSQLTDVNGQAFFNGLVTGSYELSETEQTGWTQTNISCQVGDSNEAGVLEDDEYYANIESDQTTHCLIGNIRDTGNITVDKVTDPSEDPTEFTINLTGESTHDFVLSDTDSPETIAVPTGSYSLNEVAPGGWELSSVECERIVGEGTIGLDESNFEVGSGHNISCTVTNREIVLGVTIEKSNNKPNTNAGDTVAYTLLITNTGNQTIFGLDVVDILPGGFSYVSGTTTGATTSDPTVAGNKLTWENVTNLGAGDSLTIEYQVKIANDATNGIYTNFATCSGLGGRQEDPVECNQDDSSVTLGSGTSFGGNLVGQVLGASTELPATGTPTALLLLSLGLLGTGLYLRKKHAKN